MLGVVEAAVSGTVVELLLFEELPVSQSFVPWPQRTRSYEMEIFFGKMKLKDFGLIEKHLIHIVEPRNEPPATAKRVAEIRAIRTFNIFFETLRLTIGNPGLKSIPWHLATINRV